MEDIPSGRFFGKKRKIRFARQLLREYIGKEGSNVAAISGPTPIKSSKKKEPGT